MSLVYFDNSIDEFVFTGSMYPDYGTYEIKVYAAIKQGTGIAVS